MRKEYEELINLVKKRKKEVQNCHRIQMNKINSILQSLKNEKSTFYVFVGSYWTDYDEKNVKYTGQGNLEEVLAAANNKFTKVNNRTDDQRYHRICLSSRGLLFEIPSDFVKKCLEGKTGKEYYYNRGK